MTIVTEGTRAVDIQPLRFLDLSQLFGKVLRIWGVSQVVHAGPVPGTPVYLPMERMVTLSGAMRGFLVVRSTREFALKLREKRENSPLGRYPEEEVFEELVSLFCLYLVHSFWKSHLFRLGPVVPFPSIPEDWPPGHPQTSITLNVEDFPVEIRLWVEEPVDKD